MAEELISHARVLDYKILELHVTVTQTAALGLYKRLGFVETRREVFTHTDGTSYDTVFMDLVL
jgi:ribosomal protein S18 acetylase RimI-like enzyme